MNIRPEFFNIWTMMYVCSSGYLKIYLSSDAIIVYYTHPGSFLTKPGLFPVWCIALRVDHVLYKIVHL